VIVDHQRPLDRLCPHPHHHPGPVVARRLHRDPQHGDVERVFERVGELDSGDTKGMVFKAATSAIEEELVNTSNGHSLEGPLDNVIVNYSFTEGRQEAVEKALLDLVLTDPEGVLSWLQRLDDGGAALTIVVRETLRANDQNGGAIEVDPEGAARINHLVTAVAGGDPSLGARLDFFIGQEVVTDSVGNQQEGFPNAVRLGYTGGAVTAALGELELGDTPEGAAALKLILGAVGLVDPTKLSDVTSTTLDAVTYLGNEWVEADIERAEGDWDELEETLYRSLIAVGPEHDTQGSPTRFSRSRSPTGTSSDRASIGN
jgi:hypothetical protein